MKASIILIGFFLAAGCTYHDISQFSGENAFNGVWTIEQVYANDHYGGPLYWKKAETSKQLKFTPEHEYYDKTNNDFELIGTYKILSDTVLQITIDKPLEHQNPDYVRQYEFDGKGHLTISTGSHFEGIVLEKYKISRRF